MKRGVLIFGILISIFLIRGLSAGQFGGCIDTDNNSIFVRGIAVNLTGDFSDVCDSPTTLTESYCDGNAIKIRYAACPKKCSFGACTDNYFPTSGCRDSDGGINPNEIGTVIVGSGIEITDYCETSSNVIEHFCTNNDEGVWYDSVRINCPLGCKDGACKSDPIILQFAECSELNGYSCNSSQVCTQRWFTGATDILLCCSVPCENYLYSCNQQLGKICHTDEFCSNYSWATASDTNYCCLSECVRGSTCNSARGYICNSTEYCPGSYLNNITDTGLCCSEQCKKKVVPNCTCEGRECGNNECGESCGTCASGKICSNYNCVNQEQASKNENCTPDFECNLAPQICKNDENQTMTCIDKNNCYPKKIVTAKCGELVINKDQIFGENKISGENKSLIKPNSIENSIKSYWWIFILIVAIIVVFLLLRNKKSKKENKKKQR